MPLSTKYLNLPGPVGDCLKPASLATAAVVPVSNTTSLVFTTGHIGLDLKTGGLVNDAPEHEFDAIFNCLDAALKHSGVSQGLFGAHKLVCYLVRAEDERIMQRVFQRRFPGHTPTCAIAIVKEINVPSMRAEIAAEAALYHNVV